MNHNNKSNGYGQKRGLNQRQLKQHKDKTLLHSQDSIQVVSEIRETSSIRDMPLKAISKAKCNPQNLPIPLNDILKFFTMKGKTENLEKNKQIISEIDEYFNNNKNDQGAS